MMHADLIGRIVRVHTSGRKDDLALTGACVDETRDTLVLQQDDGTRKRVPKQGAVFDVRDSPNAPWLTVDGNSLAGRVQDQYKRK